MEEKIIFKSGDLVRLKSDGPLMTVKRLVYEDGPIVCVWFDKNNNYQENYYSGDTLDIIKDL